MPARASQVLAEHMEARAAELCEAIHATVRPRHAESVRSLMRDWVDVQVAYLRGEPDRTGEWVALMLERLRGLGGELHEILAQLRTVRDVVLTSCSPCPPGLSSGDLRALLFELEARHVRLITEHWGQAEREERAAEQRRQRAMVESIALPFAVLDAEGCVALMNGPFAALVGVPRETLAGRELSAFCDEETAQMIRRCLKQRRSTATESFEGHLLGPTDQGVAVRFVAHPLFDAQGRRDGISLSLERDALESRSDENAPGYMPTRILAALPIAVQVVDQDHRVVFSNEACEVLTGGPAAVPLCQQLGALIDEGDFCAICERVFSTGKAFHGEGSYAGPKGMRWFRLSIVAFADEEGAVSRVACAMSDISEQRSLEKRLESQLIEQQRTSLVSQVAMAVAHQLRNPLGVLIGFSEMLSRGLPPDQVPGAVDKMLRSGLRCKEIVEDLLEFGQGSPGERVATELGALVRESVRPALSASQCGRIDWCLSSEPCWVECVPNQLAQVFSSLIDNALRAAATRVRFELSQEKERANVRVRDDGAGVPEPYRDRIFQPFFTTRKEEGAVGLGLSLSQSVLRELGGRLYLADSEPGDAGACFAAELPLAVLEPHPAPEPEPREQAVKKGKRVLVVDDETDLLDMLSMALELRGYEVDAAPTAAEAIDFVKRHEYDAVVLDVQLPGDLSGPECYEYLLGTQPKLAERALFITADTLNYETRRFLDKVKRPSMEKPFLVYDFVAQVDKLLGGEAPEAAI